MAAQQAPRADGEKRDDEDREEQKHSAPVAQDRVGQSAEDVLGVVGIAEAEAFLTDAHGRDHATRAELAMDAQGNFLALRVHTDAGPITIDFTGAPADTTTWSASLLGDPVRLVE